MQTISENLVSFIHFTCTFLILSLGFPGGSEVKVSACMQETQVQSLGQEGPLEKEMATHSSILAWEISWTAEPAGYSPWDQERVGHDSVTKQQHVWVCFPCFTF